MTESSPPTRGPIELEYERSAAKHRGLSVFINVVILLAIAMIITLATVYLFMDVIFAMALV